MANYDWLDKIDIFNPTDKDRKEIEGRNLFIDLFINDPNVIMFPIDQKDLHEIFNILMDNLPVTDIKEMPTLVELSQPFYQQISKVENFWRETGNSRLDIDTDWENKLLMEDPRKIYAHIGSVRLTNGDLINYIIDEEPSKNQFPESFDEFIRNVNNIDIGRLTTPKFGIFSKSRRIYDPRIEWIKNQVIVDKKVIDDKEEKGRAYDITYYTKCVDPNDKSKGRRPMHIITTLNGIQDGIEEWLNQDGILLKSIPWVNGKRHGVEGRWYFLGEDHDPLAFTYWYHGNEVTSDQYSKLISGKIVESTPLIKDVSNIISGMITSQK